MGTKVDGAISTLIQGISQQAPVDRLEGQAELLENFSCDPEKGLTRRAPVELVGKLIDTDDNVTFFDTVIADSPAIIGVTANKMYAGFIDDIYPNTMKEVYIPSSYTNYCLTADLALMSRREGVYIVNRNKIVKMGTSQKSYSTTDGIVYLLGGQYARTYTIKVTTSVSTYTATYTTPDGSESAHGAQVSTTAIASKLVQGLEEYRTDLYVNRESDVILIRARTGTLKGIEVEDGDGGANIFAFVNEIGDVGKLSRFAPEGHIVKVRGVAGDTADDYYLEFVQTGTKGFGYEGFWTECVAPGMVYDFDPSTMPHRLVYNANTDEFSIDRPEWADRAAGDDESNPEPSFVGKSIRDIALFQGRMVFLTGNSVVMSKTNDDLNFWMNSATGIIDSDPIDISSATARNEPVMEYAVPHNRDLIIFSKYAQFIIFGRNALTPQNTSLVLTTTYETETATRPVASGQTVFYPVNYGNFTGVKEFYTEGTTDINASRPITAHCTQYLKGRVKSMVSSTTFDLLLVQTESAADELYVYEYVWLNAEKAQSAWSKWIFSWDIIKSFFVEQTVFFIYKYNNEYELGYIDLARDDDAGGYQICLDNKLWVAPVHKEITTDIPAKDCVFIQDHGCPNPGLVAQVESIDGNDVTFKYDMLGGTVIYGIPYTSKYIPTRPIIRDSDNNPITTGRLMITNYKLTYTSSGAFNTTITSRYMDDVQTRFSGKFLNNPTLLIGKPVIDSGDLDIPFMNDADEAKLMITCSEPTPVRLNRLEYVGNYIKKGSRL